jgi:uncharacterized membrane protein YbaN (DUF454 family)
MPAPKTAPPPPLTTRVLRNTAGLLLLLLGVVGLVLPVLQGVLFLVGGLALIDLPIKGKAHRWLMRFAFYRRIHKKHDQLLARWRDWYGKRRAKRDVPPDQDHDDDD